MLLCKTLNTRHKRQVVYIILHTWEKKILLGIWEWKLHSFVINNFFTIGMKITHFTNRNFTLNISFLYASRNHLIPTFINIFPNISLRLWTSNFGSIGICTKQEVLEHPHKIFHSIDIFSINLRLWPDVSTNARVHRNA